MSSPRTATTNRRTGQRFYTWRNENYWSVTTIIGGGLPKPALINWAKKFTAEYAVEHLDALTTLVESDRDGAVDWLKGAAFRDRDRKAELGSEIHAATEAYVLGKPFPKWTAEATPRMNQLERFLADFQPTFAATEASVFNRTQRYAGTLDYIARLRDGRTILIDTKSGKGVYPEVALQLAAYRFAEFIGLPDGSEAPMPEVDGCACLHLTDDEYRLIDVRADQEVFRAFLYVREVFRFAEELSKTVLRAPLSAEPVSPEQIAFAKAVDG